MTIKTERRLLIFFFLLIPTLLLVIFSYYPIIANVFASFTDWQGGSQPLLQAKNIGFANYKRIFTDPAQLQLFKNCGWYLLVAIPQLFLAFVLSIFVNGKFKGIGIAKGVLLFPYLLNGIIISTIFLMFFNPDGTLNLILGSLGLNGLEHPWLQQLNIVNPSIASISIWRYYGFSFLLFYGALQSIPEDIYDACAIDGANKLQEVRYIQVPYIWSILFINILLSISGSIMVYEIPWIMEMGGNGTATPVIAIVQSMNNQRFGYASALAIVVFIVVILAISLQKLLVKEEK